MNKKGLTKNAADTKRRMTCTNKIIRKPVCHVPLGHAKTIKLMTYDKIMTDNSKEIIRKTYNMEEHAHGLVAG